MTENDAAIAAGNASGSYPSADANVVFYEAFAPYYERLYGRVDVPETVRQWLLLLRDNGILTRQSLTHEPRPKLIDIGCGPGSHLIAWAKAGFLVCGLDSSQTMLNLAARNLEIALPDETIPLYCMDVRSVTDVFERVDLAVSHLNFLNLFAPRELEDTCKGAARLVKPGGYWLVDCSMLKERPSDLRETHVDDGITLIAQFRTTEDCYEQRWLAEGLDATEYYWFHNRQEYEEAAAAGGWRVVDWFEWRPDNSAAPWISSSSVSERNVLVLCRNGANDPGDVAEGKVPHCEESNSSIDISGVEDHAI